ncbi:MAG: hypothetical protein Q9165_001033 [Trypethelium subeluteriae]
MALTSQPAIDSPYLRSLIAGGIAGTTVDLSLHPIDTLKTRLQSSSGFHPSGGFRGIYAGVGSALVGSAPGAALFFVTYEASKSWLLSPSSSPHAPLSPTQTGKIPSDVSSGSSWRNPLAHMAAATLGEVAACAVRVPTEVIKQRAQASQFRGSAAALADILALRRADGGGGGGGGGGWLRVRRELYRGWGVTVLREVPFTVIQFPLWEALKLWWVGRPGRGLARIGGGGGGGGGKVGAKVEVTGLESAVFGSVSGAVAAAVTTPLDVLKTRLMLAREKSGMLVMTGRILRESGPRAFWAGIGPRVVWISAGGAIFLGSYQWACNALGGGL